MTVECYRCGRKAMNEGEARKHAWVRQWMWGGIERWFCAKCDIERKVKSDRLETER